MLPYKFLNKKFCSSISKVNKNVNCIVVCATRSTASIWKSFSWSETVLMDSLQHEAPSIKQTVHPMPFIISKFSLFHFLGQMTSRSSNSHQ